MQLIHSPTSPFARKCRMVLRLRGLAGRVTERAENPLADPPDLRAANPLGKVPALIREDGPALFDSPVICEFLDSLGDPAGSLFPAAGEARWQALRIQALADGLCDAAVAVVFEGRRPEPQRSPEWTARWRQALVQGLDRLEAEIADLPPTPTIAQPAVAAALGYLDFRLPDLAWRQGRDRLGAWLGDIAATAAWQETRPD